jgi:4-azaleucine resistance transporter AzlC
MTRSRKSLPALEGKATPSPALLSWTRGLSQGLPIVLGYVPIGFAYGVLATNSGLSPRNTVLMSLLVYAGASQFIAAGLFAAGVPPLSIVLTTFVVNLRHLLMTASLAPHVRAWPRPLLPLFAFQVTDETFAVHAASAAGGGIDRGAAFCVNVMAQVAWIAGSWLGVAGGQVIPDPRSWGLDYALPALFCALLVMQIRSQMTGRGRNGSDKTNRGRVHLAVALITGALAVGGTLLGLEQWTVIVATLLGATLGVMGERWIVRSSS